MTKIRFRIVAGLVAAALICGAVPVVAQNLTNGDVPQTQPPPSRPQFFAGTVVELDARHVKVNRTLVGKPTESRSFMITPITKMNKSAIKLRGRVTVRYKHHPEGDVALEIQPRPVIVRPAKP